MAPSNSVCCWSVILSVISRSSCCCFEKFLSSGLFAVSSGLLTVSSFLYVYGDVYLFIIFQVWMFFVTASYMK